MASNSSNNTQSLVPQARQALDQMKYEIAGQVGVNLKQGYNGDILARDAGRIGGNMVKKMIQYAESQLSGGSSGGGSGMTGGF
jgi:hypothetical protein